MTVDDGSLAASRRAIARRLRVRVLALNPVTALLLALVSTRDFVDVVALMVLLFPLMSMYFGLLAVALDSGGNPDRAHKRIIGVMLALLALPVVAVVTALATHAAVLVMLTMGLSAWAVAGALAVLLFRGWTRPSSYTLWPVVASVVAAGVLGAQSLNLDYVIAALAFAAITPFVPASVMPQPEP